MTKKKDTRDLLWDMVDNSMSTPRKPWRMKCVDGEFEMEFICENEKMFKEKDA
jgi:hypothetical protein